MTVVRNDDEGRALDRRMTEMLPGGTPGQFIGTSGQVDADKALNVPASLALGSATSTTLGATWTASTGAERYGLRYRTTGVGDWTYTFVNSPTHAKTITGLVTGTAYEAQVRSEDALGYIYGDWSDSATGTTS